jgi:hypothetical protein
MLQESLIRVTSFDLPEEGSEEKRKADGAALDA